MKTLSLPALLAIALSLAGCNGSPTTPSRCATMNVFAGDAFYAERAEVEQEFRGVLAFRDVPSTPNGRDHRYFLNDLPVYSGGFRTEPTFKAAAGTEVVIRGKLVNFTHGSEIWAARLTSCP